LNKLFLTILKKATKYLVAFFIIIAFVFCFFNRVSEHE